MEQRNLFLAIVLSAAILFGFQYFMPHHPAQTAATPNPTAQHTDQTRDSAATPPGSAAQVGTQDSGSPVGASPRTREQVLAASPRLVIDTPRMKGSINLKGARFDDITLKDYRETVDPASPAIVLLSPSGAPDAYLAQQGWISADHAVPVPNDDTVWQASGTKLTPETPVTLTWDNGKGLKFERVISVDANYMFSIKDRVTNSGPVPVSLSPYSLVSRTGLPPVAQSWVSYEGPIGAFGNGVEDISYKSVTAARVEKDSTGGWLGFSDKYWLASIAPDQNAKIKASFSHAGDGENQRFQADYLSDAMTAAPGASVESDSLLFSGAKEVKLLAHYQDAAHLRSFVYAVDFGWFYFLTKPIFYLLDWIYGVVGNFGISILILTVIIKTLFFPLANKAFVSMDKMRQLQPEMQKLRDKYGNDKVKLNQEVMALYKRVGANPVAGCLPMLLQIPVFFSLYKVLYTSIEMRHAPFYGWIHDLSAPDPTTVFNLFGLIHWTPPTIMLGVWPLIYCVTMFLQQHMQPQPADATQAKMLKLMPIVFTFMLGRMASGLVIYWSWNNLLTILQQWLIRRRSSRAALLGKPVAKSAR